jgi:hypothetical protein
MDAVSAHAIEFPAFVLTDKASRFSYAYCAANQRELEACPLHTYLKAGRLQGLRLFDAQGHCFAGKATGRWRLDTALIREVGPGIWSMAAIASVLDVVLLFDLVWREVPCQSFESVKKEVADYLRRNPKPYVRNRPLQMVLAKLNKATTVEQLCRAIGS